MELLRRPLIALTLTVVAAVTTALAIGDPPPGATLFAAIGVAGVAVELRRRGADRGWLIALLGVFVAVIVVGRAASEPAASTELRERLGDERRRAVIEARVVGVGPQSPNGESLRVEIEQLDGASLAARPPRVSLFVPADALKEKRAPLALPGDRLSGFVRLEQYPKRALPGERSPRERMAAEGIVARAAALEPLAVEPRAAGPGAAVHRRAVQLRADFERRLLDNLDGDRAALAVALTTANRNYLEPQLVEPFRQTGTGHLLAISGLHLGVLAAILWWVFGFLVDRSTWLLRRFGRRRACGIAVVVSLGAYVALIGAPVSAVRAWVAVSLGIGALLAFRPLCPFHALAAAALGLVVWQPSIVADLGFQLSFAATLGILLFIRNRPLYLHPPDDIFGEPEPRHRRWLRRLGLFVGVSFSATISTWPVVAAQLGEVPLAGLWANLIVTPLVSALLFPLLIAGLVASYLWPTAGFWAMGFSLEAMLQMREGLAWAAALPGSVVITGVPPVWALVMLSAGALVWVASRWQPVVILVSVILIVGGLSPAWMPNEAQRADELRVHFIPVGQGDATLVEFPAGETMLVDGGGSQFGRDPGRFVIVPYLKRLGIGQLDWIVVTHADTDHLGGLFAVAEALEPHAMLYDGRDESEELRQLRERLRTRGGALVSVEESRAFRVGEVGVEVIRPGVHAHGPNDASLVVHLERGPAAVLLPGDVERPAERWLVDRHELGAVLLKAPHHGSKTSSSEPFLAAVEPAAAIISAGRFNHFGHPHDEVVGRYRRRGTRLFETAHQGLVRADIDAEGAIEIHALHPP